VASQRSLERQLRKTARQMAKAREELAVSRAQLDQVADEAADAKLRSVVSEDGNQGRVATDAVRHRDRLIGHCDHLQAEIAQLEASQDRLLDELSALG